LPGSGAKTLEFLKSPKSQDLRLFAFVKYKNAGEKLYPVALFEPVDSSAGVHELLLARKKGMTFVADFDLDGVALFCRGALEALAAGAHNGNLMEIGMYAGFHYIHLPKKSIFRKMSLDHAVILYCFLRFKSRNYARFSPKNAISGGGRQKRQTIACFYRGGIL